MNQRAENNSLCMYLFFPLDNMLYKDLLLKLIFKDYRMQKLGKKGEVKEYFITVHYGY